VFETGTPGFELTGLECDDSEPGGEASSADGGTATVRLDLLETVTCTYANVSTDEPPGPTDPPGGSGGSGGSGPPSGSPSGSRGLGRPALSGQLPFTGVELWPLGAAAAVLLLLAGAVIRAAADRRRPSR
jgi:hypothetical protein